MLLLIDNYDSFTYNLFHYLSELGAEVRVYRNDELSFDDVISLKPDKIVISPGPGVPEDAGLCVELIQKLQGRIPLMGVCLGHQAIGLAYGASIVREPPMHGKVSAIQHDGKSVFTNLPSPFNVTRYHSLTLAPTSVPDCLEVTAKTKDGVIMGVQHKEYPLHGVQFHPESIASEHGHAVLDNFLKM